MALCGILNDCLITRNELNIGSDIKMSENKSCTQKRQWTNELRICGDQISAEGRDHAESNHNGYITTSLNVEEHDGLPSDCFDCGVKINEVTKHRRKVQEFDETSDSQDVSRSDRTSHIGLSGIAEETVKPKQQQMHGKQVFGKLFYDRIVNIASYILNSIYCFLYILAILIDSGKCLPSKIYPLFRDRIVSSRDFAGIISGRKTLYRYFFISSLRVFDCIRRYTSNNWTKTLKKKITEMATNHGTGNDFQKPYMKNSTLDINKKSVNNNHLSENLSIGQYCSGYISYVTLSPRFLNKLTSYFRKTNSSLSEFGAKFLNYKTTPHASSNCKNFANNGCSLAYHPNGVFKCTNLPEGDSAFPRILGENGGHCRNEVDGISSEYCNVSFFFSNGKFRSQDCECSKGPHCERLTLKLTSWFSTIYLWVRQKHPLPLLPSPEVHSLNKLIEPIDSNFLNSCQTVIQNSIEELRFAKTLSATSFTSKIYYIVWKSSSSVIANFHGYVCKILTPVCCIVARYEHEKIHKRKINDDVVRIFSAKPPQVVRSSSYRSASRISPSLPKPPSLSRDTSYFTTSAQATTSITSPEHGTRLDSGNFRKSTPSRLAEPGMLPFLQPMFAPPALPTKDSVSSKSSMLLTRMESTTPTQSTNHSVSPKPRILSTFGERTMAAYSTNSLVSPKSCLLPTFMDRTIPTLSTNSSVSPKPCILSTFGERTTPSLSTNPSISPKHSMLPSFRERTTLGQATNPTVSPRPCIFSTFRGRTKGILFLLFLVVISGPTSSEAGSPDAKRLYDDLLSNYNKLVRPVVNVTDVLTVRIKLKLSQLIDVVSRTFSNFYLKRKE